MFSFLEYINTNIHVIWVWIHKHKNRTVALFSHSKYSFIFLGSDYSNKKYPIFSGDRRHGALVNSIRSDITRVSHAPWHVAPSVQGSDTKDPGQIIDYYSTFPLFCWFTCRKNNTGLTRARWQRDLTTLSSKRGEQLTIGGFHISI